MTGTNFANADRSSSDLPDTAPARPGPPRPESSHTDSSHAGPPNAGPSNAGPPNAGRSHTDSPKTVAAPRPQPGGTAPLAHRNVARIGFGAMQLERLEADRNVALELIRHALELGINHIDTAQFYGDGVANELLAEALRPDDDIVLVSKVGADYNASGSVRLRLAQRPEQLRSSVEDNLRTLGIDQLPVVNLRRADAGPGLRADADNVVDLDDQLAAMTAMRDEGMIGAIGLSAVNLDVLRRAIPAGIACVQNAYNLIVRDDEELLQLCLAEGIAWVPFFPLGSAFGSQPKVTDEPAVHAAAVSLGVTESQVGLAWLLGHAPNILLIPGTADRQHLESNVAAGEVALDNETTATLDGVAASKAA